MSCVAQKIVLMRQRSYPCIIMFPKQALMAMLLSGKGISLLFCHCRLHVCRKVTLLPLPTFTPVREDLQLAGKKMKEAFIHMVEEIPRQGRLEGCLRQSAATHLICGLESVF